MLAPTNEQISALEFPGRDSPGTDWLSSGNYAALKPRQRWSGEDYLKLCWEIIRRTPRYRWHHYRLKRDGLLGEQSFKGGRPYLSSKERIGLPGWEEIPVWKHYCQPPIQLKGEVLGEYVSRNEAGPWLVAHATWFFQRAWGLSHMPDPAVSADELDLRDLFSPNLPEVTAPRSGQMTSEVLANESLASVRNVISSREAVVNVRLDLPLADTLRAVRTALKKTRTDLGLADMDVRLRQRIPSSPLWLRAWDFRKSRSTADSARLRQFIREGIDRMPKEHAEFLVGENDPVPFSDHCKTWAGNEFETLLEYGTRLIESEEGGPFLAHCLGAGLTLLAERDEMALNKRQKVTPAIPN